MKLSSSTHGVPTSGIEVTNVSSHGLWLLTDGRELFLSYDDFPWFKDAAVGSIIKVEQPSVGHFRWPDLDVDVGIESIEDPAKFPLKAK